MPNARMHQAVISMVTVPAARKAVASHWASSRVMPSAPMMSGIATLTMVDINRVANEPIMPTLAAHQR
jgi:hypothetical protein